MMRPDQRVRCSAVAWIGPVAALLLAFVPCALAVPEEEIVLKDGTTFHGRVLGTVSIRGRRMLRIETDFGEIKVEERQIRSRPRDAPQEGAFFFERIRIVQVRGTVEKRSGAAGAWTPVRMIDEYGPVLNAPDAILKPGDVVRTGAGAFIDLMPHKDVWVRITASTEVEFPGEPGEASLVLTRGRTLQRIADKPRGKTFVVKLPSRLVKVKGTEFLLAVGEQERVSVTHGEVEVGRGQKVGEGTTGCWGEGASVEVMSIDPRDTDALNVEIITLPEEDMVYIPGGKYRMGEKGLPDAPPRTIVLSGFLMDRREVAAEEFSRYAAALNAKSPIYFVDGKPPSGQERQPVYQVSLVMARGYAAWAGKRIPTEAQWEAAARGPKGLVHPWGNRDLPRGARVGRIEFQELGKTDTPLENELLRVDEETPDVSPFGLLGMVTSVYEWVRDLYADDYYTRGEDADPEGPRSGVFHIVRGAGGSSVRRQTQPDNDDKRPTGFRTVVEP